MLSEAAELVEIPSELLAPGKFPGLWKGEEITITVNVKKDFTLQLAKTLLRWTRVMSVAIFIKETEGFDSNGRSGIQKNAF